MFYTFQFIENFHILGTVRSAQVFPVAQLGLLKPPSSVIHQFKSQNPYELSFLLPVVYNFKVFFLTEYIYEPLEKHDLISNPSSTKLSSHYFFFCFLTLKINRFGKMPACMRHLSHFQNVCFFFFPIGMLN